MGASPFELMETSPTDAQVAPSGIEENLDLFTFPTEDIGVLDRHWVITNLVNTISADTPLEFNIDGNAAKYVDLKNSQLIIKCKILKPDKSDIAKGENVGPVNLFLASMWKQVEIQLNHENLKGVNTNYPYKAMLDTLLFTSEAYKKGQLCTQLFKKDSPDAMDASTVKEGNQGYNWRLDQLTGSREFQMVGGLFLDACEQERFILNGVHINLKLWPSNNSFKLMSGTTPEEHIIKITCAKLNYV